MNTSQSCGLTTPTKGTARVIDCETDEARRGSHTVVLDTKHRHILHTFLFEQQLVFKLPRAAHKTPIIFLPAQFREFLSAKSHDRKKRKIILLTRILLKYWTRQELMEALDTRFEVSGLIPGNFTWDLWWRQWHWSKFYSASRQFFPVNYYSSRSRWPCRLRRSSVNASLLGSRVRILLRAKLFVSCVWCVGRGLCDKLFTRMEESYRVWVCVCVCVHIYVYTKTHTRKRTKPKWPQLIRTIWLRTSKVLTEMI